MRKFKSKLTVAMIILVVVTSFLSVLFAILTVNGKFLERPEMRHVMFGLAAGDVMLLIILVSMIAIGFILVMRSIMKPILELDKAVSKVTEGDYNVKVDTYNKAEAIADLLDNFNRMVEQLRNNEYLHRDFSSNISHEFKTPLAIIKGYADLLEEGNLTEEEQKNYAQYISKESKRLSTLTANLLSLSSLDYDKIHGRKTTFSIDEQIRQAVLNMEAKWLEKNIDIELNLKEVYFTGEEELINQVWYNLLDNAIKFTEDGGRISLSIDVDQDGITVKDVHQDSVTIKLEDTGVGMDVETLKHIYEQFYRGDTAKRYEGTGLGLSLVQRIIHLHDGKISADSKLGEGTCFTIVLPMKTNKLFHRNL